LARFSGDKAPGGSGGSADWAVAVPTISPSMATTEVQEKAVIRSPFSWQLDYLWDDPL
jgi:hypothetical protein